VAYDVVAESLRLIAGGLPDGPVRLSRRHRFAAVAVDVTGDIAGTRFLRRGAGCIHDEFHFFERDAGEWVFRGGGGWTGPSSAEEFCAERDHVRPGGRRIESGPAVRVDSGRWFPTRGRWLRSAHLLLGREVAEVVVGGNRRIAVPSHGHVSVVWDTRRPPRVTSHDTGGLALSAEVLAR
jgi:hypothetical protein